MRKPFAEALAELLAEYGDEDRIEKLEALWLAVAVLEGED